MQLQICVMTQSKHYNYYYSPISGADLPSVAVLVASGALVAGSSSSAAIQCIVDTLLTRN